jgi:hypothetical protein
MADRNSKKKFVALGQNGHCESQEYVVVGILCLPKSLEFVAPFMIPKVHCVIRILIAYYIQKAILYVVYYPDSNAVGLVVPLMVTQVQTMESPCNIITLFIFVTISATTSPVESESE